MTKEDRWVTFLSELKSYIEEHHHLPDKHKVEHRGLLNQVKYVRKKIKEGKLEEEKVCEFDSVMSLIYQQGSVLTRYRSLLFST